MHDLNRIKALDCYKYDSYNQTIMFNFKSNLLLVSLVVIYEIRLTQCVAKDYINGTVYEGDVTYYTEWAITYGSCGFTYPPHSDYYVAALSNKFMALPNGIKNPSKVLIKI